MKLPEKYCLFSCQFWLFNWPWIYIDLQIIILPAASSYIIAYVCLSVRPSGAMFPWIFPQTSLNLSTTFTLCYEKTYYLFKATCQFLSSLRPKNLVKQAKFWVSGISEERIRGMGWNLTCWCMLTTLRTDWIIVIVCCFPYFGIIPTKWNRSNLRFPGIFWRNKLWFYILMNPNHLQNGLDSGHGLFIFLILAAIFCGAQYMNGLGFGMLMYPDHLQNWLIIIMVCWFSSFLAAFWIIETGQIYGFWTFSGQHMVRMAWILTGWYIWTNFKSG